MTRYGRRPIPLGPLHLRGCRCPKCDRTERAKTAAQTLAETAARENARRALTRAEAREEVKREAAAEAISREEKSADAAAAKIRAAARAAADDPKAARLRELRAAGKTMAEAFEIIEREGSDGVEAKED
jgi:hypothetical protein